MKRSVSPRTPWSHQKSDQRPDSGIAPPISPMAALPPKPNRVSPPLPTKAARGRGWDGVTREGSKSGKAGGKGGHAKERSSDGTGRVGRRRDESCPAYDPCRGMTQAHPRIRVVDLLSRGGGGGGGQTVRCCVGCGAVKRESYLASRKGREERSGTAHGDRTTRTAEREVSC